MEISFKNQELRDIFVSPQSAEQIYPQNVAFALRSVAADLRSAKFLDQFAKLQGIDATPTLEVALGEGFRLKLESGHRIAPTTDGKFDPGKVYRLKVQDIEGGHDD